MLVLTGLFPNLTGNQSMLNSIKGFSTDYEITLITVADLSAKSYLSRSAVEKEIPNIRIISLWPEFINKAKKTLASIKREKISTSLIKKTQVRNEAFSNTSTGIFTRLAFFIRSIVLFISGIISVLRNKPSVICAYEINGMFAVFFIKRLFPKIQIFGKFQGTVLGDNLINKDFFKESSSKHPLDFSALKYAKILDGAIMTNDGTHGDIVLEKFGLEKNKILFIPNGVDEKFIAAGLSQPINKIKEKNEIIQTISVSRLIGWKRVDRVVEALGLIKKSTKTNIIHTIIGGGAYDDEKLIRDLISENSLNEKIHLKGAKSFEEVIFELSKSDLLISMYGPTNVTNPVFEALAMGVPVLTIREKSLLDVLGNRANGCFFIDEPGSENLPHVISQKLIEIDHDSIQEKKEFLRSISHPSWLERSRIELEFIRQLTP